MQKDALLVALTSLVSTPVPINGWELSIIEKLGNVPKDFSYAIAVAARLSAGISAPTEKVDYLESIFNSIALDSKTPPTTERRSYMPTALSLEKDVIFPETQNSGGNLETHLEKIVSIIKQSLPKHYREDESYLEEILSILHRTTLNIPSAFSSDVSYFDQQRMTAALAVCLLEKNPEEVKRYLESFDKYKEEPIALLVGGDLSGIQDFIYTISAKGAARTLRGRSFYLQLLTEAVLRFVLSELEIPYSNVIYSGGGHFFLLAPLSKQLKIEETHKKISSTLLKHHSSSLYFALGSAVTPLKGFAAGEFPFYWGEMHSALARKKQQRYVELGDEIHGRLFKVREFGGNPIDKCDICGEDHRKTRTWDDLESQDTVCSLCYSFFEDIGKQLPRNNFVALRFGSSQPAQKGTAAEVLAEFGMAFEFMKSAGELVQKDSTRVVLWAFEDPKENNFYLENVPVWLRYTGNQVPQVSVAGQIRPLSFDELQDKVRGGFERLGALRMDVDGLGEIFKHGLGNRATLTRLATLSFRMSLFFEGWLKKICEKDGRENLIYTVYAGGDDVFLLGPWDIMPEIAQDIVNDFAEYTGHVLDFHLSAGLAFIGGKYPIYQAADDAKEFLEQAKSLDGKNAFSYLDTTWKWSEFSEIANKQKQIEHLVTSKDKGGLGGPRSLIQILRRLSSDADLHAHGKNRRTWGHWIWMGMYSITRMMEQNKTIALEIKSIQDSLHNKNYENINQWGAAARWTQLKTRKKNDER